MGRRPPKTGTTMERMVTVRVHQSLLDRAEALQGVLGLDPEVSLRGTLARADVLRLALVRGIAALEARYLDGGGKPHRRR